MKVSKGQSQPEIVADIRLLNSLHGSGFTIFVPGFDCDSIEPLVLAQIARPAKDSEAAGRFGGDRLEPGCQVERCPWNCNHPALPACLVPKTGVSSSESRGAVRRREVGCSLGRSKQVFLLSGQSLRGDVNVCMSVCCLRVLFLRLA